MRESVHDEVAVDERLLDDGLSGGVRTAEVEAVGAVEEEREAACDVRGGAREAGGGGGQ